LLIEFKDQGQQTISTFEEEESLLGDWEEVSLSATAPPGAWQITVSVRTKGRRDVVEFDDLMLADLNGPPINPGDFDEDGDIDNVDLGVWRGAYGLNDLADADGDGNSNGADFLAWQRHFNWAESSTVITVPESPTWVLLFNAITGLGIFKLRSRR
jgi:hypothetical protein